MMMHGSWFTTGARPGILQKTLTGTVPGTPTADVLFQLAQSVFLSGLEQTLQEKGLNVRVHENAEAAPMPAWADDVAVCTPCCDALSVVPMLATLVQTVEEGSREIGTQLNFDVNKTAALCIFRGPHSREARRRHLLVDKPALHVRLNSGAMVSVRLVDSYQHLGGILTHDGSCKADVAQRRRAAQPVLVRLCKTLFRNSAITSDDRRDMLISLVLRKFLFGAGHWICKTKGEQKLAHSAVMSFYRSSCWAIAGCSSKLLRDEEVCSVMGVLSPGDLLHCERVRLLLEIVSHGPGFLWDMLLDEKTWA